MKDERDREHILLCIELSAQQQHLHWKNPSHIYRQTLCLVMKLTKCKWVGDTQDDKKRWLVMQVERGG